MSLSIHYTLSTLERQMQEVFTRLDDLELLLPVRNLGDCSRPGESKPSTQQPTTNSDIHYRLTRGTCCKSGVTVEYVATTAANCLLSVLQQLSVGNSRNARDGVNLALEWLTHILDGVRTEG
jgi:hypothetical protein